MFSRVAINESEKEKEREVSKHHLKTVLLYLTRFIHESLYNDYYIGKHSVPVT